MKVMLLRFSRGHSFLAAEFSPPLSADICSALMRLTAQLMMREQELREQLRLALEKVSCMRPFDPFSCFLLLIESLWDHFIASVLIGQ